MKFSSGYYSEGIKICPKDMIRRVVFVAFLIYSEWDLHDTRAPKMLRLQHRALNPEL